MTEDSEKHAESVREQHTQRDAETQTVIGVFVIVMAIPVLIGTVWAEKTHAMIVNAIAGLVLLTVGVVIFKLGRRTARKMSS